MTEGLWTGLYIVTFIAFFAGSVAFRLKRPMGFKKDPRKISWNDSVGKVYIDIPYDKGEKHKFDLYLPADGTKKSYGLVVYIHAGGFNQGDKSEDAPICRYYCSLGYVSAGINYTLNTKEKPASVYEMSREIQRSIPVIKEKAAQLGYNIDRMAISGGSAGAGLALIFAYRDAGESPIPVKCVMGGVGPACFEPAVWFGSGVTPEGSAAFLTALTGQEITAEKIENSGYKELIKPISACELVTASSPPTLIAYGKYDKLVPFAVAERLVKALDKHKVPYDFIVCPRSGHGLQNDPKELQRYLDLTDEYLEKYIG